MSLQTPLAAEVPKETRRLVEPLLPAGSAYRLVGNETDQIISDKDFLDMYAPEGRPAVNPVVLALVSIFQFLEKLPDRAAAEAAVTRMDWKYASRQELASPQADLALSSLIKSYRAKSHKVVSVWDQSPLDQDVDRVPTVTLHCSRCCLVPLSAKMT